MPQWPEFVPWQHDLRTKTYGTPRRPITRAELARRLAKLLVKFTKVRKTNFVLVRSWSDFCSRKWYQRRPRYRTHRLPYTFRQADRALIKSLCGLFIPSLKAVGKFSLPLSNVLLCKSALDPCAFFLFLPCFLIPNVACFTGRCPIIFEKYLADTRHLHNGRLPFIIELDRHLLIRSHSFLSIILDLSPGLLFQVRTSSDATRYHYSGPLTLSISSRGARIASLFAFYHSYSLVSYVFLYCVVVSIVHIYTCNARSATF